jgi:hypothetical protein
LHLIVAHRRLFEFSLTMAHLFTSPSSSSSPPSSSLSSSLQSVDVEVVKADEAQPEVVDLCSSSDEDDDDINLSMCGKRQSEATLTKKATQDTTKRTKLVTSIEIEAAPPSAQVLNLPHTIDSHSPSSSYYTILDNPLCPVPDCPQPRPQKNAKMAKAAKDKKQKFADEFAWPVETPTPESSGGIFHEKSGAYPARKVTRFVLSSLLTSYILVVL